jgi:hypothetical protein
MGPLHEKQILKVVGDLCHFIMHEVIHPMGTYFYKDYELAMDYKYISLREWTNPQHITASSRVGN